MFLLISTTTFGQYAQDGQRLWITAAAGYNTQSVRFALKGEVQYPGMKWLTFGGELSHAAVDYGYWNLNTGEFSLETEWITGAFLRLDYHPLFHWRDSPKLDPYIGIGGGVYRYYFIENPSGHFDFSIMVGSRYWISDRWGIDLDLGIREKLGFNLGVTYSFKE